MHVPSKFKQVDAGVLSNFIREYPLATLVVQTKVTQAEEKHSSQELDAMHLPLRLQRSDDQFTLSGHIAKANPLWETVSNDDQVLIIFNGPNAYVSPNYYPSKSDTGRVVPTWNYSVVHVRGRIKFHHDGAWILKLIEQLTNDNELDQPAPWRVDDAPEKYTRNLLKAIVGVEIEVDSMEGNFKLSQNKGELDRLGVVDGLSGSEFESDKSVAEQMRKLYDV